jgi:hypothetical protein
VISVEDWAEIRRLHRAEGVPIKEIARRLLLAEWPTMPATVIAERIGWRYSMTTLKDRVRQIRPEYLGVDPVDRVSYQLWVSSYRVGCGSLSRDTKRVGLLF